VTFITEFKNKVAANFHVETPQIEGLDSRYDSDVEVVEEEKGSSEDDESDSDGEYIAEGEGSQEEDEGEVSVEEVKGEGGEEKQSE